MVKRHTFCFFSCLRSWIGYGYFSRGGPVKCVDAPIRENYSIGSTVRRFSLLAIASNGRHFVQYWHAYCRESGKQYAPVNQQRTRRETTKKRQTNPQSTRPRSAQGIIVGWSTHQVICLGESLEDHEYGGPTRGCRCPACRRRLENVRQIPQSAGHTSEYDHAAGERLAVEFEERKAQLKRSRGC